MKRRTRPIMDKILIEYSLSVKSKPCHEIIDNTEEALIKINNYIEYMYRGDLDKPEVKILNKDEATNFVYEVIKSGFPDVDGVDIDMVKRLYNISNKSLNSIELNNINNGEREYPDEVYLILQCMKPSNKNNYYGVYNLYDNVHIELNYNENEEEFLIEVYTGDKLYNRIFTPYLHVVCRFIDEAINTSYERYLNYRRDMDYNDMLDTYFEEYLRENNVYNR